MLHCIPNGWMNAVIFEPKIYIYIVNMSNYEYKLYSIIYLFIYLWGEALTYR